MPVISVLPEKYKPSKLFSFRHEISIIRTKSAILSVFAVFQISSPSMATLVTVMTYLLTGQPITPVNVFMLLAFINILSIDTCTHLANALIQAYDAYASLRRIEEFLLLENLSAISRDHSRENPSNSESSLIKSTIGHLQKQMRNGKVSTTDEAGYQDNSAMLSVTNLTYRQSIGVDAFILHDIEFTTASQGLTVVTGPVGSGKSTLLSAIAGELSNVSGSVTFQGTISYAHQTAWAFSGTIRENILFGLPYDEPKYTRVIESCALADDILQFPDGDQTFVGERGEVLSGGQRARISLARAVYADADLYLLDDPISAVNLQVGQHIFDKCIKDLLGNKTRVLISHQEQHMKEADQVIVLYKGSVLDKGTFAEMQEKGILRITDVLCKTDKKLNNSFLWKNKEKSDFCEKMVQQTNESKGLDISREDRAIGVVTLQLYWNYFRSGIGSLAIFALFIWCFITQGKAPFIWRKVVRVKGSPSYPSYPGRANFSFISLQNFTNSLCEKQKVGSARRVVGSFDGRVTLLAVPTFPHINTLARPAGSTRLRRDDQSMREHCCHIGKPALDSINAR